MILCFSCMICHLILGNMSGEVGQGLHLEEGEGEKAAEETGDAEALESAGIGFQKRMRGSVDGVEEDRGVGDAVEEEEDKAEQFSRSIKVGFFCT